MGEAAERITTLLSMANLYPDSQLIFTGGSGLISEQSFREADYVQFLFEEISLSGQAILFESESRNTAENVANSKALVNQDQIKTDTNYVSVPHAEGRVGVFCQANWPVIPYPVDHRSNRSDLLRLSLSFTKNLSLLEEAIHEWIGLIAYRVTGRTDRFVAGDNNQCDID